MRLQEMQYVWGQYVEMEERQSACMHVQTHSEK